jgi:hypothetical protein
MLAAAPLTDEPAKAAANRIGPAEERSSTPSFDVGHQEDGPLSSHASPELRPCFKPPPPHCLGQSFLGRPAVCERSSSPGRFRVTRRAAPSAVTNWRPSGARLAGRPAGADSSPSSARRKPSVFHWRGGAQSASIYIDSCTAPFICFVRDRARALARSQILQVVPAPPIGRGRAIATDRAEPIRPPTGGRRKSSRRKYSRRPTAAAASNKREPAAAYGGGPSNKLGGLPQTNNCH